MSIDYKMIAPGAIAKVFNRFDTTFPRQLRIDAMKQVLQPLHAKELQELTNQLSGNDKSLPLAEYARYHRLKEYVNLSEFQLENEFSHYRDVDANNRYFQVLWERLENHLQTLDAYENILTELESLPQKPQLGNRTVRSYNKIFDPFCTDPEGSFDGVTYTDATSVFVKSANRKELYALADKYGVSIPKYLNKADLQKRLLHVLSENGNLDQAMEDVVKNSSVRELRTLLEANGADSKPNITKPKMVKMIIEDLEHRRLSDLGLVEEEPDQKPEPVPVVEEPTPVVVVPTPQVIKEVVASDVDYSNYLEQIINNQKDIISLLENREVNIEPKHHFKAERIYNYIVIVLIVLVSIIWILYGITTLF